MEVILKEDVANLGHRGDVVKVADGYGRNFLLPRKLALQATLANKAVIDQMKSAAARRCFCSGPTATAGFSWVSWCWELMARTPCGGAGEASPRPANGASGWWPPSVCRRRFSTPTDSSASTSCWPTSRAA